MSGGRGYLRRLSKPLRGGCGWPTADESIIADEDLDGSGIGLGLAGGPKCLILSLNPAKRGCGEKDACEFARAL